MFSLVISATEPFNEDMKTADGKLTPASFTCLQESTAVWFTVSSIFSTFQQTLGFMFSKKDWEIHIFRHFFHADCVSDLFNLQRGKKVFSQPPIVQVHPCPQLEAK